MDILKFLTKIIKLNPTLNLNDPACLQTISGLGAISGVGVGIILVTKKNWPGAAGSFAFATISGGVYCLFSKHDSDKTTSKYQHEETLARIKHPLKKSNPIPIDKEPESQEPFRSPKMPTVLPPVLDDIVKSAPDGFEVPFLMASLSMMGALCFSRVRAKRGGKLHAPNFQVVVTGASGQGKGKIMDIYNHLFSFLIDHDNANLTGGNSIIQTGRITTSISKFYEALNSLKSLHLFVIEPEISAVTSVFNKGFGIDYTLLRHGFDGEVVSRSTKNVNFKGPLNMNFVFTGTPETVARFFSGHIEDGTANRIICCEIPDCGRTLPSIDYSYLSGLCQKLEVFHSQYCWDVDRNGNEVPASIHEIGLQYLNQVLDEWVEGQYDKRKHTKIRREMRGRVSTIAFRAGMIAHMLYGEPDESETLLRLCIQEFTLFVANYTMERYIFDFGGSDGGDDP